MNKKNNSEDIFSDIELEKEGDIEQEFTKDVKALKKKLSECLKEREEYLRGWQRARAEYVNLTKDAARDKTSTSRRVKELIILDIMPIIDSFEIGFSNRKLWESVSEEWRIGIENIYEQLLAVLKNHGFISFDDKGVQFDPNRHVPAHVETVQDKKRDGTVLKTIQRGYILGEHIIRPARVIVGEYSKGKTEE